jgi:RecB family exonuclease
LSEPGVLPAVAPLQEIARISPSRYYALQLCPLKEIWAAARSPVGLPAHPAAYLGTVIHSLLEDAGRGLLDGLTADGIATRWDELVLLKEQELARSWLERRLLPLSRTLRDAEVRKRKACLRAAEITDARRSRLPAESPSGPARFEQWVQTTDGKVGGFIDVSFRRNGRLVIRDYKSGTIQSGSNEIIREEYEVQLKLYAALYATTFQEWPEELELVGLQGAVVPISFRRSECEALCIKAVEMLDATNARIRAARETRADRAARSFARPSPEICGFCQYRPMCSAYQLATSARAAEMWPPDTVGLVREVRLLGNGSGLLVLESAGMPTAQIRLRGIEPDIDRHPALRWLQVGEYGAAFNMRRSGYPDNYVQGESTILYAGTDSSLALAAEPLRRPL